MDLINKWEKQNNVEWLGHRTDMSEIFRTAAVVVLPSRREGLPLALIEAASSGKPLIATNVPGCREIVIDEYNGYLVPVNNSKFLANQIEKIISNNELMAKMGKNSRYLAEKEFASDIINSQYLAIYKSKSPSMEEHN